MKRKIYALLICSMLLSLTACKSNEVEVNEKETLISEENISHVIIEEKEEVLDLIYAGGDELVEVPMSDRLTEGEDLIKVKIPQNYIVLAYDSEMNLGEEKEEPDFPMTEERVTLKESIQNGLLDYGKGIFVISSSNLETDSDRAVEIEFRLNKFSYQENKDLDENKFNNVTLEFGTKENPAYYIPEKLKNNDYAMFHYYINDDIFLTVYFRTTKSFIKEMGLENILEKLYSNIEIVN